MNESNVSARHFESRLEFYRNAVALVPAPDDPDPGAAIVVFVSRRNSSLSCGCRAYRKNHRCNHIKQLTKSLRKLSPGPAEEGFDILPADCSWYRLASVFHDICPVDPEKLTVESRGLDETEGKKYLVRHFDKKPLMVLYTGRSMPEKEGMDEAELFFQRTGVVSADGNPFHRGRILDLLSVLTMNDNERILYDRGMKSRRQAMEQSFWYRSAYHCIRSGKHDVSLFAKVDESTGKLVITAGDMEIHVPHEQTVKVKKRLWKDFENRDNFETWSESVESILKVTADAENNLRLTRVLLLHLPDGSSEIIEQRKLKNFCYKDRVYIPEKQVFAVWRKPDRFKALFGEKYTRKIKSHRIPEILEKIEDLFSPPNIIDKSVYRLQIHKEYTHMEIETISDEPPEREWWQLHFSYGFGENISVALKDIYHARKKGRRFLPVNDGWVDVDAVNIDILRDCLGGHIREQLESAQEAVRLSRMDLLRFQAMFDKPVQIKDIKRPDSHLLQSVMNMSPPEPATGYEEMTTSLRTYQRIGVDWLAFLHENRFGGLLCDEMGLGKTHQLMAMMVWLSQVKRQNLPFLVVCPTTVISHWMRKIREHASSLTPVAYYGADRDLKNKKVPGMVLVTSYGILLRDIDQLAKVHFGAAIFDEAQNIKNPETKSYSAAESLNSEIKIGVTGTPVENRLGDLKALMDLVLPGYLGSDYEFEQRYEHGAKQKRIQLKQLIRPFVLRRTKSAVLDELPEKIEDIRYCRLTETQVKLYREAVSGRAEGFVQRLRNEDTEIPYLHIFALLTLLKQICNHPASITNNGEMKIDKDRLMLNSGKWDLFVELLENCLENDRKVVVYSQFVAMIHIILKYLKKRGVVSAVITGGTLKRGDEIDRFNNDPDCKVFVGSLRAGGSGIDLTGGSVVIHYDRWWNAAREDQATDRVHRIGQTRGVQVFKLVTEGTLEEKISAIIDRKKKLMSDVISEDDPGLLNTFTRQELIELLTMPV